MIGWSTTLLSKNLDFLKTGHFLGVSKSSFQPLNNFKILLFQAEQLGSFCLPSLATPERSPKSRRSSSETFAMTPETPDPPKSANFEDECDNGRGKMSGGNVPAIRFVVFIFTKK